MEPDQLPTAAENIDQEKSITTNSEDKNVTVDTQDKNESKVDKKSEEPVAQAEPSLIDDKHKETDEDKSEKSNQKSVENETNHSQVDEVRNLPDESTEDLKEEVKTNHEDERKSPLISTETEGKQIELTESSAFEADKSSEVPEPTEEKTENKKSKDEADKVKPPSFPGTVKSVPGSNDVKIEFDSNSLLDRVILFSLKNSVVDNSRLDAAKNKYMMNNGNANSSFNSNSNGSDSNSSSKSVEKIIEEFKDGCSKARTEVSPNNSSPTSSTVVEPKSDINNESTSNGAEACAKTSNTNSSEELMVKENSQNVISSSQGADQQFIESSSREAQKSSETSENEALDFREKFTESKENSPTTLDLTIPHRDEKTVPPIKRNHALYVGLPDFSKQIFTAPSISRPTTTISNQTQSKLPNSIGPPKIRNPDFSATSRAGAPELQMRHPDFSKGFSRTSSEPPSTSVPVTPSNFPEIIRKNNYISDLQLKPVLTSSPTPQSSSSTAPTYKIDYRSSAAISQKLLQESKPEQSSTSNIVYPNMKKEGINAYNQQQMIIDEPMPHIIHKNQFLHHPNEQHRVGGWSDRGERLLGGSSTAAPKAETDNKLQHSSSEDLRRNHPAYYQQPYKEREYNNNNPESQKPMMPNEFSLEQKEQQLRQEGTIITIKNEPTRTPTREINERRSADLFRDIKLKQPKESPDSARRSSEYPPLPYHQSYPDMPTPSYPKSVHLKSETTVKNNHTPPAPPLAYPQDRNSKQVPMSSRGFHSSSPVGYSQPKSPLTVPPGPSMMHPPQNWPPPPPLVMQQMARHVPSPGGPMSSPSPNSYHHHASPSQSPHMGYPYPPYPVPPSQQHMNSKPSHSNYQPYPNRNVDVKDIPNRHYMQPGSGPSAASSSSSQGYYHQKYPDFTRQQEPERKHPSHDPNQKFMPGFVPIEQHRPGHPAENKYHRFQPHQELEIRTIRDQQQYRQEPGPSYYQNSREHQEYNVRIPEPHMRLPEAPRRSNANDDSRNHQHVKVEHRMDEPPKIIAGPSNLPLRRPEPTEVSVIAKVKIEPVTAPRPSQPTSSIKSAKSIFAEVKRESPLDLSVKTVKTKADSTGCEQDARLNQRPEPSGLKVEFNPNFDKIAKKTDCRSQARLGPQDYPSRSSSLDRTPLAVPQKYPNQEAVRTPPIAAPHTNHAVPSSSRSYYDQKYSLHKDLERPRAPIPELPNSSQYPNRHAFQSDSKYPNSMEHQRPAPSQQHPAMVNQAYPRPEDKQRMDPRTGQFYSHIPPHHGTPPAQNPYPHPNKPSHVSHTANIESSRPPNLIPPQQLPSRDSLFYERERDRKYVEEILKGRTRPILQPELRHFQQVPSPPRKRVIENQPSHLPPKQVRIEEVPPRHPQIPSHPVPPLHYQQSYDLHRQQKVDNHVRNLQLGQPPALVKSEAHLNHLPPSDSHYYHDARKDAIMKQSHQPYPNNQYYPNPKAEMIHRSDPSSSYKAERIPYPNQNFQQRPDDNTLQVYPRINHPIPQASDIKHEHQSSGPLPGTSGESARLVNGLVPSIGASGSNGNIARGADQSTIMKLKSNLEMKEQMKQFNKNDNGEDNEQKKDLSPRQFRSKGELKAFVPLPANSAAASSSPAVPSGPSAFDLLDWGSACNDFVQQLETGKKKSKKKRPMSLNATEEKSSAEAPGTTANDLSEVPKDVMKALAKAEENSSSEDEKPLVALVNPETGKAHSQVVEKISEKICRNVREKQRLELEQKMAARLGKPSSSESETDNRRQARPVKRVRRLRKRAALGMKKTDEEMSVEEEETEEESAQRRRSSKSVSKIDELSSSDDETKSKDKKSDPKPPTKAARKVITSKSEAKKEESSSEATESDESTTIDKINKLSSPKNAKKLKDLGAGTNIKNMLEEEKTMTRSKRKLEIEKKLSNSKVLRNEKVVQNVSPDKKSKVETTPPSNKKVPPKRKDSAKSEDSKRKAAESDSDTNANKSKKKRTSKVESSSSEEESQVEEDIKADRLRPRKIKTEPETPAAKTSKDAQKKKAEEKSSKPEENAGEPEVKQSVPCRIPFSGMFPSKDEKTSRFTPGWEADTYSFKRSLKIPAGLITIGRPPQHGISHSLPDLDPQTSDTSEIFSEFVKSKDKEVKSSEGKTKTTAPQKLPKTAKKSSSIIDLLHERAMQKKFQRVRNKKATASVSAAKSQADDDDELLPTPGKESEKVFEFKKNIFEPSIMTSRLRTENNALRKREMLKEVFGADERPRSAPPVGAKEDDTAKDESDVKISYEEKYREYLEKMNMDFPPKTGQLKTEDSKNADASVKDEDDDDDDESVVASERDLVTNPSKGKSKKARTRRCKGSSGFDYIRKKKKPSSNANENPMSVNNIIKKRLAAMENLETKDENDIVKEIKGWVLNKGVGESVLHKASRLDYADVIAYCLERMKMNPDSKDNAGYTPLHEACSRGHLEIARTLLQYGANHSEAALSGIRPLHEAIENGHVEIVRLLISYGADPCLATYSGQLPIAMAEDKEMEDFLSEYLIDICHRSGKPKNWFFDGPYSIEDPSEEGYEVFDDIPINKTDSGSSVASVFSTSLTSLVTATTQMSDNETVASETTTATPTKAPSTPMKAPSQDLIKYKMKKCDTNSNNLVMNDTTTNNHTDNLNKVTSFGKKTKNCSVILNNIDSAMKKIKKLPAIPKQETPPKLSEPIQKIEEIKHKEDYDDMVDGDNIESDNEFLELEESDAPLPPLYLLKDEGSDKWVLLTDLCNLLKVKSKDAVLKQICPSSPPSVNKELIRELKMSDFLEKAVCLQLFCAGEKLNVRASKVSLVRYNESVKNLLGVQTIRMNM